MKNLLFLTFLFAYQTGYCQSAKKKSISTDSLKIAGIPKHGLQEEDPFKKLVAAIGGKQSLEATQQKLEALKKQAIKSHDDMMLAHALYEMMKIKDLRTEDTLYFRNSAFMDTIINNPFTSPALRAIMHVLRAQRINGFDRLQSHRYKFNTAAYRSKNIPVDYVAFTSVELDSAWTRDLAAALTYNFPPGDAKNLLWLSSEPQTFLFAPRFGDIVWSEYINLYSFENFYNSQQGTKAYGWPSLPLAEFREKLDSVANADKGINILKGYRDWMIFNKNIPATSTFIESLARQYIFSFAEADSASRQAYIGFLRSQTLSEYPIVKAHAIYQLCLIWNQDGNRYFSPYGNYQYYNSTNFDPRYRILPDSALRLYEKNKPLLDQYPSYNHILGAMAGQIGARSLSINMNDVFVPGEAIPIKTYYKNADTLFYRVVRVNADDVLDQHKTRATLAMLAQKPVTSGLFELPPANDHNNHATYLKLDALPSGHYRLLFNTSEIKGSDSTIYSVPFNVTSISLINADERVYVLDRKTGLPLAGASIQAFDKKSREKIKELVTVNNNGYAIMQSDSLNITYKGDTLGYDLNVRDYDSYNNDDTYDKDEYDDFDDYYEDELQMHIFTDRSIYRPGQTVQYKIILLTRDPKTGDPILFDSQNLNGSINKWLKKNHPVITLNDPFNHTIDSVKLVPNDFGSFAGSFVIPKTAATGNWNINGTPETNNNNSGEFSVEEYKRPTIELSMEKQKKMLFPGQQIIVKLKLRSFSGGSLGHIPITYIINRGGVLPTVKHTGSIGMNSYIDVKIADTIGYTNDNGELDIPVNDTLLKKYNWGDVGQGSYNYNYAIGASATDATGETSSINQNFNVSSQPVRIIIPVGRIYDRHALPTVNVSTVNDYEGPIGRKVNVKIYAIGDMGYHNYSGRSVDLWYYPEAEWNKWFPQFSDNSWPAHEHKLIMDTVINTAQYEKLVLSKQKLVAGYYELDANCRGDDKTLIGHSTYNFKVFDSGAGTAPDNELDYMPLNNGNPGDAVTWYSYNQKQVYVVYHILYRSAKNTVKSIYNQVTEQAGLIKWQYHIPADAAGQVRFYRAYVSDNEITQTGQTFSLIQVEKARPEIIIEKYRRVMTPGAEETFTLSVKTKNKNTAAELMTTMYDAALDKLNNHDWSLPQMEHYRNAPYAYWTNSLYTRQEAGNFMEKATGYGYVAMADTIKVAEGLQGKVSGLQVSQTAGLNEVVVVGYGTEKKVDVTGALGVSTKIVLRGNSTISQYKQPLIIVDGEIYSGNMSEFNSSSITQIMILKGAEASAIYGSRAAEGVLMISTKGPIILPEPEKPVVKIRKNFNETAFFFPRVHAGADGNYSFSFTMPESATEWNWKVLAYTQKSQFVYLERKLQTQLNLMVQPNVPRLLYQGDRLKLQSRITNLDTVAINGTATCKIEDAVTGEDITAKLVGNSNQPFSLNKKSSGAVSFMLTVPADMLNPLKVVISASTSGASDAEEHIIPVLSSKILVRQSRPVKFDQQPTITLPAIKLPTEAQMYGLSIAIAQKPQAALVYALPWLANYSYDCAEQTFNKIYAQYTAIRLMQTDTSAQKMYKEASKNKIIDNSKDSILPDEMAEEATPWLRLGNAAVREQADLLKLLDTSATKISIDNHMERLYKLQRSDGGLAWFDDGKSNAYMSAYVLAGFGRLKQQGWESTFSADSRWHDFIDKLYNYNQEQVLRSTILNHDLSTIYAGSYWLSGQQQVKTYIGHVDTLLKADWGSVSKYSLNEQALLIITTFRYNIKGSPLYIKAQQQLQNIKELAIQDKQNGLRWKDIADAEELDNSAEETMALLCEAFDQSSNYPEITPGMVQWLLTARQDQHWQTTKSTAAAIDMLQKQKGKVVGENRSFSTDIDGKHLSVSDDLLRSIPSAFTANKQLSLAITLQQQGSGSSGTVTWYYFAEPKSLDTLNKAVHISKRFYVEDKAKGWVPLTGNTPLKEGDKVKVKLTIETASRLKFVHISDSRAAAFEPSDNNSGYHYDGDLSYYLSVKDTGLDFFTESIPRGISEISYELVVAMYGRFTSGPARLQCMYQPSVAACSDARIIITN